MANLTSQNIALWCGLFLLALGAIAGVALLAKAIAGRPNLGMLSAVFVTGIVGGLFVVLQLAQP